VLTLTVKTSYNTTICSYFTVETQCRKPFLSDRLQYTGRNTYNTISHRKVVLWAQEIRVHCSSHSFADTRSHYLSRPNYTLRLQHCDIYTDYRKRIWVTKIILKWVISAMHGSPIHLTFIRPNRVVLCHPR